MAVVVFPFFSARAALLYASIPPPALRLAAVVVRLLDDGQLGVRVGHGEVWTKKIGVLKITQFWETPCCKYLSMAPLGYRAASGSTPSGSRGSRARR